MKKELWKDKHRIETKRREKQRNGNVVNDGLKMVEIELGKYYYFNLATICTSIYTQKKIVESICGFEIGAFELNPVFCWVSHTNQKEKLENEQKTLQRDKKNRHQNKDRLYIKLPKSSRFFVF